MSPFIFAGEIPYNARISKTERCGAYGYDAHRSIWTAANLPPAAGLWLSRDIGHPVRDCPARRIPVPPADRRDGHWPEAGGENRSDLRRCHPATDHRAAKPNCAAADHDES